MKRQTQDNVELSNRQSGRRIARLGVSLLVACVLVCGFAFPNASAFADDGAEGESPTSEEPEGGETGGEGGGDQPSEPEQPDPGGQGGGEGGDPGGSGSGEGGDPGGSEPGGSEQPSQPDPKIMDIAIFVHGTEQALGYYSSPSDSVAARITARGGTLELDSYIYWDDWVSSDQNSYLVEWSVDDPSVATITQGGVLTACADGLVRVRATVPASISATGDEMQASALVEIAGQENSAYVKAIRITDASGNAIGTRTYILEDDLSIAKAEFFVEADVCDASTGETATYSTMNGPLSSQVPGLSDIKWYVGDSAIATIDEDQGWFRPKQYCIVQVFAYSTAGLENERVQASITVQVKDPEGGLVQDGYYPQNSLKVKAYWSDYAPANLEDDSDERFVINKEYSLEELEGLGTLTYTYTALGGGNYFTMTGQGVLVSTVLQHAGVRDLSAIRTLSFGTVDYYDRPVSYSYIFGTNHYYYPLIQYGMYGEAVQVPPMLAFVSNEIKNADTAPNYDMSEATRFRLLVGATRDGGNTGYEIKWVHTMYVILDGAPPVEHGDGGGGVDEGGEGSGSGSTSGEGAGSSETGDNSGSTNGDDTGSPESGDDSGGIAAGNASDEGDDSGAGLGNRDAEGSSEAAKPEATSADQPQPEAESAANGGAGGKTEGAASPVESDAGTGGMYSVYQAMNMHEVDEETPYRPDNPFRPLAGGAMAAMLLAGMLEGLIWYRRQVRAVVFVRAML